MCVFMKCKRIVLVLKRNNYLHFISMDNEPFDNDLFDPPPKQQKQQPSATSYQQQYTKQQQQTTRTTTSGGATTAYLSATKNASGHSSLPSGIPNSEIQRATKAATTDAAASASASTTSVYSGRRSRSPYADFQYSPKNLTPVSHIVQSGSYVEILKQQRSADISPTHHPANQKRHHHQQQQQQQHQRGVTACHNKSYGDFLTITPRRKGNKLVTAAAGYEQQFNDVSDNLESYHHRIEPLHLLGLSNEKNYTFLDYRAMEAISNADTLEMGTSLVSGRIHQKNRDRYNANEQENSNNKQHQQQNIAEVSTEYQYFMREKNLSPPSAFSDNITASKKNLN